MPRELAVFAVFVSLCICGFVIAWIAIQRRNDTLRAKPYRATPPDARAAYADDELQDDLTVVPAALRSKANG